MKTLNYVLYWIPANLVAWFGWSGWGGWGNWGGWPGSPWGG